MINLSLPPNPLNVEIAMTLGWPESRECFEPGIMVFGQKSKVFWDQSNGWPMFIGENTRGYFMPADHGQHTIYFMAELWKRGISISPKKIVGGDVEQFIRETACRAWLQMVREDQAATASNETSAPRQPNLSR